MVFETALEDTFKVLEIFHIDWPSCLKEDGLSFLYHPYSVTTQLIGSNALIRHFHKLTFNKAHLLIEIYSR
jgi:hypothetical protein